MLHHRADLPGQSDVDQLFANLDRRQTMTGIPSIAFSVRYDELPATVETCWDVAQIVQQKIDASLARQTAFENRWQRLILERARAICPAPALDYLFQEVRILTGSETTDAVRDLARLRSLFLSDIALFNQLGLDDHNPFRKLSEHEIYERALRAEIRLLADDDDYSTLAEAFFSSLHHSKNCLRRPQRQAYLLSTCSFTDDAWRPRSHRSRDVERQQYAFW